ncbi:MAG: ribonuclease HII [Rhodospirillales bacterium]|nr:MAG: ribonuclease HII [Rhodospirillales bacterium]
MVDYRQEAAGGGIVAGIDEAGRGPWAGPVVAAAVVIRPECLDQALALGVDDSKLLSADVRASLFRLLPECAVIGVGLADVAEIDSLNILQATFAAMARAVEALAVRPDRVLVDGSMAPPLSCAATCVVGGDRLSLSIAAASIVAKVTRDRIMRDLAVDFPGYGWERNAGYGTPAHRDALARLGVTPHHRRSFQPVRSLLQQPPGRLLDQAAPPVRGPSAAT